MKTCAKVGCSNPIYSHLYCRVHQWLRKDDKYLAYKERKKQGKIPPKSKKRKVEEVRYKDVRAEKEAELRAKDPKGRIFCFFSGKEIKDWISWHHTKKREGANYTNKEWIVPSINEYHLDYHYKSVDWLLDQSWYSDVFLPNLKNLSEELYQKELKKQEKAPNKLNPTIKFDEEDDF